MKSFLFCFVFFLFFVGCNKPTQKAEPEINPEKTMTATTMKLVVPEPYVAPPDVTKGWYKHFGFSGSLFRDMKPGEIMGLESGLMALYTQGGEMWAIDTEPNDSRAPLEQRKIYLARISGEVTTKHCGVWLPDFKDVPSKCIDEERILSWGDTKKFLETRLPRHRIKDISLIERFLKLRVIDN